jgi:hypothetical protein
MTSQILNEFSGHSLKKFRKINLDEVPRLRRKNFFLRKRRVMLNFKHVGNSILPTHQDGLGSHTQLKNLFKHNIYLHFIYVHMLIHLY